ncbi:pitrilysin family protein [soil metagenome]
MAEQFKSAVLENGLTIIAECDPGAHTAAAGFFVKTGARDEDKPLMGVSHFLEHMMFKGTARRNADEINRAFDEIGAKSNAYTSSELTAFYAATLPEHLPAALDVLSDMMRPALRNEDFGTEKGVILEEIAMYKDDPSWVLYERLAEEHYGTHPLAYRVLGTRESITELAREHMQGYFDARYSADNTVLALAGRVDFDAAVAQARQACGAWRRTGALRAPLRPAFENRSVEIEDAKVNRAYRMLIAEGPSETDDRRYAAAVMALLLGGPDNSLFHWALVEPGLAEEAEASYEPHDGVGDVRLSVVCEPEKLEEVWGIVEREIAGFEGKIRESDVRRIAAKIATGVTLAGERPEGRMHRLGRSWLALGRYTTLAEELEAYTRVSVEDVRRLLREMPLGPAGRRTIATMRPSK